jgi:hypothetical protein
MTEKLRAQLRRVTGAMAQQARATGLRASDCDFSSVIDEAARSKQRLPADARCRLFQERHRTHGDTYGGKESRSIAHVSPKGVTRFGAEEFVVLLPDTAVGNARLVAQRLRRQDCRRRDYHVFRRVSSATGPVRHGRVFSIGMIRGPVTPEATAAIALGQANRLRCRPCKRFRAAVPPLSCLCNKAEVEIQTLRQ